MVGLHCMHAWWGRAHWCAQVCDVAGGQQVVHIDQEALIDDLVVSQDEDHLRTRPAFSLDMGACGIRLAAAFDQGLPNSQRSAR